MNSRKRHLLVLSIYPNSRGFTFVLFEGPLAPVDWGIAEVRGPRKNERCLMRIRGLFGRFAVDALVLQEMSDSSTRRAERIKRLNRHITRLAEDRHIPIFAYSRLQVRACLASIGLTTKQGIAEAIAKRIPAFERYVPPIRKPWMSEHSHMGLFDSAALALTYYSDRSRGSP